MPGSVAGDGLAVKDTGPSFPRAHTLTLQMMTDNNQQTRKCRMIRAEVSVTDRDQRGAWDAGIGLVDRSTFEVKSTGFVTYIDIYKVI